MPLRTVILSLALVASLSRAASAQPIAPPSGLVPIQTSASGGISSITSGVCGAGFFVLQISTTGTVTCSDGTTAVQVARIGIGAAADANGKVFISGADTRMALFKTTAADASEAAMGIYPLGSANQGIFSVFLNGYYDSTPTFHQFNTSERTAGIVLSAQTTPSFTTRYAAAAGSEAASGIYVDIANGRLKIGSSLGAAPIGTLELPNGGVIYPLTDGTTAWCADKADASTTVFCVDTTNARLIATTELDAGAGRSIAFGATTLARSSGFGTNADASFSTGSTQWAFDLNIGTGGAPTSGVISLPTAPHGWICNIRDITTPADNTYQSAYTTNTATFTTTIAWSANDHLYGNCFPF